MLNAQLQGDELGSANFNGANIGSTDFDGADMSYTTITDAQAIGVFMANVNFTNANLTGTDLTQAGYLTNDTWSNTTCPDGTNSNNDGDTCLNNLTP
jgi:uncharacterized protein YjbI with pentapeptide repeats